MKVDLNPVATGVGRDVFVGTVKSLLAQIRCEGPFDLAANADDSFRTSFRANPSGEVATRESLRSRQMQRCAI
jgi:hypothetical protein